MDTVIYEWSYYQVQDYETCPRKWAWRQLDGVLGEKNRFAVSGIGGHELLRDWLRDRKFLWDQEMSKSAAEIVKLLPPPQLVKREDVERSFGIMLGGETFVGSMDLFMPPSFAPGEIFPTVYDHKFTSDVVWAIEPEEMKGDIQCSLYAAYALVKTNASRVRLQWTYSRRTKPFKAKAVAAEVCGADIRPRLERTIQSAREMRAICESGMRTLDLPYNAEACERFGGCQYRKVCNLTPEQQMESVMSQMSAREQLIKKLQDRKNGAGAIEAAPQQVNPPVQDLPSSPPPQAHAVPAVNPLQARLAANKAVQVAAAAPAPAQSPPPPAAVAAEPVPQRGPGRPKKDNTAEVWMHFAAAALRANIDFCYREGVGEVGAATESAAQYADAMVLEYAQRF